MMKNASGITALLLVAGALFFAGCATPLMDAAMKGDTKEMERLIAAGEDVNAKAGGGTALHRAAMRGHVEVVRLLLEKGADPNAKSHNNSSVLQYAVIGGNANVVRLLLEKGADPDMAVQDKKPLLMAQQKGYTDIVSILSEAEERQYKNPNARDKKPVSLSPSVEAKTITKSDVDDLPSIMVKTNQNAYAIVIGIETYRQQLPKADYAAHDARTMTEYLTKVMGYPEENVVTLVNDRALKSDFEKYFEKWLPNNVEKDGTVFVYYSGHGAPNPKTGDAFLVPYDGDPAFINETGYSIKRLYEALEKLQAKEIIVALDSCFSGAGGRSVLAKGARPLVISLEGPLAGSQKTTVFSAASGEQVSSTYDEKGHGLFTYFMLDGLKGKADVNEDGKIDSAELFEYVRPRVERVARKQYNNEQSPQLVSHGKKKIFLRGE